MDRNDLDKNINYGEENDGNYHFGSTDRFESQIDIEKSEEEVRANHSEDPAVHESDGNDSDETGTDTAQSDVDSAEPESETTDSDQDTPAPKKSEKRRKRREPIPFGLIFRYFITALAAANLVLLFVFNYNVPGFSYVINKLENYRDHVEGVDGNFVDADNTVIFEYDKDTYTYEGKGEFDPTVDVVVKSLAGNELSTDFLTFSVTGESSKKVIYSYKSEDGQYYGTTSRDLKLENYNAPVIVLSGTVPMLTDDTLAKVAELSKGIYSATDGYGKDISDQVTVAAVPDTQYNGEFIVQFSVTNIFGDTAKNELRTDTDFKKPHMKLAKTEDTISRGGSFDPLSYVLYAVDADGSNLMDLVDYEGTVDTFKTGDYEVKYELTTPAGQNIKNKKLTVHVVD